MAKIKPFRAWRPREDIVQNVASRPYDVLSSQEARAEASGNPYSFYHIIKSEIDFAPDVDVYSDVIYQKAKNNFLKAIQNGIFFQDKKESYYLYQLHFKGRVQTGLVALSSINDYFDDVIKKHEYTRPEKEQDRIRHMQVTGINAEPLFFAYRSHTRINEMVANYCDTHSPITDFEAEDGIRHILWQIDDESLINEISDIFAEQIPQTYIADGHHRSASAAKVGKMLAEQNPQHSGDEPYNYFLTVLFPDDQLQIMDYNRLVRDLGKLSEEAFWEKLQQNFTITPLPKATYPQQPYQYSMYFKGKWYSLQLKKDVSIPEDAVGSLDIQVLSDKLLADILQITDQRTDKRIDFVGGIRGLSALEQAVEQGDAVLAIAIRPVSMEQLLHVADSGEIMPPKSTWFEPKLRSGVVVYQFEA
ncbi:MAG: DUF1015 domain-containing protein [Chitinophagales bacterium]|nr:DUF1015 domain-containing protein [Bacteroidota bacterium]